MYLHVILLQLTQYHMESLYILPVAIFAHEKNQVNNVKIIYLAIYNSKRLSAKMCTMEN